MAATRRRVEPDEPLTGQDLLDRLPTEVVQTPVGGVLVHALGALDMIEFAPKARAIDDGDDEAQARIMVEMVARGLHMEVEDAGRLSLAVIAPLFTAISRISGLDEDAVPEAIATLKALPNDES